MYDPTVPLNEGTADIPTLPPSGWYVPVFVPHPSQPPSPRSPLPSLFPIPQVSLIQWCTLLVFLLQTICMKVDAAVHADQKLHSQQLQILLCCPLPSSPLLAPTPLVCLEPLPKTLMQ